MMARRPNCKDFDTRMSSQASAYSAASTFPQIQTAGNWGRFVSNPEIIL
jgi:hypothetical protein